MDTSLSQEALAEMTANSDTPCLSLYQPTHRHGPENQQDPIRFRNLVKTLEKSLSQQHDRHDISALLKPLDDLLQANDFWQHTLDGLAVFRAPGLFRVFRVQRALPELAIVADSFHTKPLRRFLQTLDRFQILGLTRTQCRLFEGNRHVLDEIALPEDFPDTIEAALGEELTDPRLTVTGYGGPTGQGNAGANVPMHHGHGGKKDQIDLDTERYFREVAQSVFEDVSKKSRLPLILAALPEHHHLFQTHSRNHYLLKTGIQANPDGLTLDELRQRAWEILAPEHETRQRALINEFMEAQGKGLGSDEPGQVAEAAASGRVSTLLIEADRQIPGHLDRTTGRLEPAELDDPAVDDLLDDLGELVETMGGTVRIMPPEQMPAGSGVAATYRY